MKNGAHNHETHSHLHDQSSQALQGDVAIDPVCDMKVDPKNPKGGTSFFGNTTYYFCSPKCKTKFEAMSAA
jgi:Cu+-exporting ATPase